MNADGFDTSTRWQVALSAFAVLALVIGVTQPKTALRTATLMGVLVTGIVAVLAVRTVLAGAAHRPETRLAKPLVTRKPSILPSNLTDLLRGHEPSGDLAWPVRVAITNLAADRLAPRGLHLRSLDDEPRIRAVVSGRMWEIIRPLRTEEGGHFVTKQKIPASELRAILDELETL